MASKLAASSSSCARDEHDGVYGRDAGQQARTQLRATLEAATHTGAASEDDPSDGPAKTTVGEVVDVEQFYDEDPARRASEEISFGDLWRSRDEPGSWALSWLVNTGELIAMSMTYTTSRPRGAWSGVPELDLVPEVLAARYEPKPRGPTVEVLVVERDRARIEALVGDWKHEQVTPDGFGSLRQRIAQQ